MCQEKRKSLRPIVESDMIFTYETYEDKKILKTGLFLTSMLIIALCEPRFGMAQKFSPNEAASVPQNEPKEMSPGALGPDAAEHNTSKKGTVDESNAPVEPDQALPQDAKSHPSQPSLDVNQMNSGSPGEGQKNESASQAKEPLPAESPRPSLTKQIMDSPPLKRLSLERVPRGIYADGKDHFFLDYKSQVLRVSEDVDQTYSFPAPDDLRFRDSRITVNQAGMVGAVIHASKTECNNGNCSTRQKFISMVCEAPENCRTLTDKGWTDASGESSELLDAQIDAEGTLGFGISRTTCSGSGKNRKCETKQHWTCGSRSCEAKEVEALPFSDWPAPVYASVSCSKDDGLEDFAGEFKIRASGHRLTVPGPAMYQKTCAIDPLGQPHVVFHDPSSKTTKHAWLRKNESQPKILDVVGQESGLYNGLALFPDGRTAIFAYSFRNPFNKGVTATVIDQEGNLVDSFWVTRSRDQNPGWEFSSAASSTGRVLVAYKSDARKSDAEVTLYHSLDSMKHYAAPEATGWEKEYQDHFLLAGLGAFYPIWFFHSIAPSPDKDGVPSDKIFNPQYDFASNIINSFKLEGRWGSFSLGVTYLTGFIHDTIEDSAGTAASTAFDYVTGNIGWDRLLWYHDLRIEGAYSRMQGKYSEAQGRDAARIIDTDYTRFQLTLLNAYRIRYGLFYQGYDFRLPIYVYEARKDEISYHFVDSFSSDVRFYDFGLTIGYSRLDYAAKYENQVFDWFVDGDVGIGLSFADLKEGRQIAGENVGTSVSFMLPFNLEVGLLAYKRFYRLHGFGGYVRLAYKAEGNFAGLPGRPGDREDDDDKPHSVIGKFSRLELRHGPFLDVGLVF